MNILLLNAGSSSLKFSLMDSATQGMLAKGQADWSGEVTQYHFQGGREIREIVSWKGPALAVQRIFEDFRKDAISQGELAAIGHRIVHGGDFSDATRITPEIKAKLEQLSELAPLHNPPSLETLNAAEVAWPTVPHIAVFDTSFHRTIPPPAKFYPLPAQWTEAWGIRRFGFHGLSHAYSARRAGTLIGRPSEELRLVTCHLGHGCSASAVANGRCVDTTMGFTPLEGLMMATRSGSIDPGILLYVQGRYGLTAAEIDTALNRNSGLLGVSSLSGDMRTILDAAADGHERANLAVGMYVYRIRQAIGALTVTLGGLDALVFTGGVGENAPKIRAKVCEGLEFLGLVLDPIANESCQSDTDISSPGSAGRILTIAAREDLSMLHDVQRVVNSS